MVEVLEANKTDELKTIKAEKDTWILKLPAEICRHEGFAEGTMVSLTIKDVGIKASIIRPLSPKIQEIAKQLLEEDHELYEELKTHGD